MIGKSVTHYDIVEKLGEGGMGAVYKAHDRRLDRTVALKFLPPHLSRSLEDRDRFLLEAKATSALNHPNILTVYDLGEAEGQFFIVSEFVDGRTLRRMLDQGRIPLEQVLEFAVAIAGGLSHAHARGIIHRDIKPENVMVTPESRVKIMDFGLARPLGGDDRLTHPGMLMGTARYMSPEQIEGKAVDQRSDVFAFGSLLYELIGARPPFEGEYEVAVLYGVVNAEPAPLDELNPAVPAPLVRLIARCMEKSPSKRFASFDEILPQLRSLRLQMSSGSESTSDRPSMSAPSFPAAILPETLLIGREGESEALRQAIVAAHMGTGRAVFVKGESGVGKTTVVSAAAREAHAQGMHVLWGRSLFQEPGVPYHPYATAFRAAFPQAGNALLDSLSEDAEKRGLHLAGRLPLIRSFLGFSPTTPHVQDKEQLWDAVLALLGILNRDAGVMLILEDLQWADRSSIGLLAFLARNIARSHVLIVGVYRPTISGEEPGVDVAVLNECVRQLRIEGIAQEIEISRLPLAESRAVAKHLLAGSVADSGLVEKICQASDGNPLFLVELIKLLKTGEISPLAPEGHTAKGDREIILSERVNDVILQRISRLSDSDREILEIGSCDGVTFTSEVLLACLGTERLPLLKRLQVLEKALGLIRQEGRRYRFDHPLIRQVLYAGILPELREEYHRTIAAWLIEHHRNDAQIAASVAHHLLASNQDEQAVDFLLRAAEQAGEMCAFEDAEAQYL
ncbi:MAG TPA: protein kinase, partial [Bacteroidota bacterium]|nr:protein kinase [Bacteroidota bacterium]